MILQFKSDSEVKHWETPTYLAGPQPVLGISFGPKPSERKAGD